MELEVKEVEHEADESVVEEVAVEELLEVLLEVLLDVEVEEEVDVDVELETGIVVVLELVVVDEGAVDVVVGVVDDETLLDDDCELEDAAVELELFVEPGVLSA